MAERYEREIAEILERMEQVAPKRGFAQRLRRWQRRKTQGMRQGMTGVTARVSPGRLMVIGLILLVGSLLLSRILGPFTTWLAFTGLLVLVAGYVTALSQTSRRREQTYWRGHPSRFYLPGSQVFWSNALQRWRAWWRARGIH